MREIGRDVVKVSQLVARSRHYKRWRAPRWFLYLHGLPTGAVLGAETPAAVAPHRSALCLYYESRDTSFREIETVLEQFAVNARCSPGRILGNASRSESQRSRPRRE